MERKKIGFWDEQAKRFQKESRATGWGGHLRWIEKRQVKKFLPKTGLVLDLGCGNGYIIEYLTGHRDSFFVGLDLSKEMVKVAKKRLGFTTEILRGNAVYLPFKSECFDYAYSIRTLVNITSAENQFKAVKEVARVLKNKRTMVFIECLVEGIKNLNKLRKKMSLPNLSIVWYNRFFGENEFRNFLARSGVIVLKQMWLPIISISEKVLYPKFMQIRGATRFFQSLYYALYYVDKNVHKCFPLLGYDFIYVCRKIDNQRR